MHKSALILILCFVCSAPGITQTQSAVSAKDDPAAQAVLSLEHWRESRIPTFMNDFGELNRYREANAQLKAAAPDANRVVFFGDERLQNAVLANCNLDGVVVALESFCGTTPANDDCTMLELLFL